MEQDRYGTEPDDVAGPPPGRPRAKRAPPLVRLLVGIGVLAVVVAALFSQQLFPGNSRLYDAIEAGDVARARQLLASGAEAGMVDVVRELLGRGVDVPVARPDGSTALYHGRGLTVQGRPMAKEHLDPEIRRMLERAGAR